jgi:hypothetical protein
MSMKVGSADYDCERPEILGVLHVDDVRELRQAEVFETANKTGRWKFGELGRGGLPTRMLVSIVELGECQPLEEGDVLTPVRDHA